MKNFLEICSICFIDQLPAPKDETVLDCSPGWHAPQPPEAEYMQFLSYGTLMKCVLEIKCFDSFVSGFTLTHIRILRTYAKPSKEYTQYVL